MQNNLVTTALKLEERMKRSPLHTMHIWHPLEITGPGSTVVNFLFADRANLEEAVRLEIAYDASTPKENDKLTFPDVPYLTVTASYNVNGTNADNAKNVVCSEGVAVLRHGHEQDLRSVRIELCSGSGYIEVNGLKKYVGDLVVGMSVSPEGRIAEYWKGRLYQPIRVKPIRLRLRQGMAVDQAFDVLERYVNETSQKSSLRLD